jgi:hypothetical protein
MRMSHSDANGSNRFSVECMSVCVHAPRVPIRVSTSFQSSGFQSSSTDTNNLPALTDLTENPYLKIQLFFRTVERLSQWEEGVLAGLPKKFRLISIVGRPFFVSIGLYSNFPLKHAQSAAGRSKSHSARPHCN